MKNNITIISINAQPIAWRLKKMNDQAILRANWITKNVIAVFLFWCWVCHINATAIPIRMYNKVHTGPKIQLGGFQDGLFIKRYQLFMDSTVLKPLNRPKARQIAIQTAILINSDFNFYSLVFICQIYSWRVKSNADRKKFEKQCPMR